MKRHKVAGGVGALVVLLAVTEVALRAVGFGNPPLVQLDPHIEYHLKPGNYRQFHARIDVNRWGMRGDEVRDPKSGHRILLVGDSIVFGTFRLDQNELISVTLRNELQKLVTRGTTSSGAGADGVGADGAGADGTGADGTGTDGTAHRTESHESVEVLNVAANSWGPVNQWAYLSRYGTFDADVAVWILSSHDWTDVPVPGAAALLPTERFLTATQDLINVVRRRSFDDGSDPVQAVPLTAAAIKRLIELLASRDIPLLVALHWSKPELESGALSPPGKLLMAHLLEHGITPVSLAPALQTTEQPYADSIHVSPSGAAAIGTYLTPLVDALLNP